MGKGDELNRKGKKKRSSVEAGEIVEQKESKRAKKEQSCSEITLPPVVPLPDIYQLVVNDEDTKALSGSHIEDRDSFMACTAAINQKIKTMKKLNSGDPLYQETRQEILVEMIRMRQLNRLDKCRIKSQREKTHSAKQRVDELHLQLQNQLYELQHLRREADACLMFRSKDEDIDLIDVEEFYNTASPDIAQPETTRNDLHLQKKARLEWELHQRKELDKNAKSAMEAIQKVKESIQKRKEQLRSLVPHLQGIHKASLPVLVCLDSLDEYKRDQNQLKQLLPQPLFSLYKWAYAYHIASDPLLSVKIDGDPDAVQVVQQTSTPADEDSDTEPEDEAESEQTQRRKRKASRVAREKARRDRALAPHPLTVILTIQHQNKNTSLVVKFYYITYLNIVTVKAEVQPGLQEHPYPDQMLCDLFEGDTGESSPNPSNTFQLASIGLDITTLDLFTTSRLGTPYQWAQRLAGIQLMDREVNFSEGLSSTHMEVTVKALRARLSACISLADQLSSLVRGDVEVSDEVRNSVPCPVKSSIASWRRSTLESCPESSILNRAGLLSPHWSFFQLVVQRRPAKVTAVLAIHPRYPVVPPLFTLKFNYPKRKEALVSLRDIETELNVHWKELCSPPEKLLSHQIHRLIYCTDVLLESTFPEEFPATTKFLRYTRGRTRTRPLMYLSKHKHFTQR